MPRLDRLLVSRGLYRSRARARDAILRGAVRVEGKPATKPGAAVDPDSRISIADEAQGYASRSALKLKHALDYFGISPKGLACLDLGASTGGFTQVLLERGARHVTAVEVGHGQMAPELARNPRVSLLEGLNARDLGPSHLPEPLQLIVADVSFISLKLALPPALALAAPGAHLIALVKPQFEAGPAALDKAGIVRDPSVHAAVCRDLADWIVSQAVWTLVGIVPSPIPGGDGNPEFLLAAQKS